jgi:hypothetical protein
MPKNKLYEELLNPQKREEYRARLSSGSLLGKMAEIASSTTTILNDKNPSHEELRELSFDSLKKGPPMELCMDLTMISMQQDAGNLTARDFFNKLKVVAPLMIKAPGTWKPLDGTPKTKFEKLLEVFAYNGIKGAIMMYRAGKGMPLPGQEGYHGDNPPGDDSVQSFGA